MLFIILSLFLLCLYKNTLFNYIQLIWKSLQSILELFLFHRILGFRPIPLSGHKIFHCVLREHLLQSSTDLFRHRLIMDADSNGLWILSFIRHMKTSKLLTEKSSSIQPKSCKAVLVSCKTDLQGWQISIKITITWMWAAWCDIFRQTTFLKCNCHLLVIPTNTNRINRSVGFSL